MLPGVVLEHTNYVRLSSKAVKLLNDLGAQYNGYNNGDLSATWSLMKERGWKSKESLQFARDELLHYGLIMLTRQGRLPKVPSLYALTFRSIDECNGKLDVAATRQAPMTWKESRSEWKRPPRNAK
jgi:hypothetical protein